jgi:putative two-component system response regulator
MTEDKIRAARILVADDQEESLMVIGQMLSRAGYTEVRTVADSRQVLDTLDRFQPDLLVLDLHMPEPDGFEILDRLAVRPGRDATFPILALTADLAPITKLKALSLGTKDFLTKPADRLDLLIRVRNLIEARLLHRQCAEAERQPALAAGFEAAVDVLARVLDVMDPALARRAARVSQWAGRLAREMNLGAEQAREIESAARLYDFGMLAVPPQLRDAVGTLRPDEAEVVRRHTTLPDYVFADGEGLVNLAREIAAHHHERWDGEGYPQRLRGEQIPLASRIVAVAMAFEERNAPERAGSPRLAAAEIHREAGTAFDPAVGEALLRAVSELNAPVHWEH